MKTKCTGCGKQITHSFRALTSLGFLWYLCHLIISYHARLERKKWNQEQIFFFNCEKMIPAGRVFIPCSEPPGRGCELLPPHTGSSGLSATRRPSRDLRPRCRAPLNSYLGIYAQQWEQVNIQHIDTTALLSITNRIKDCYKFSARSRHGVNYNLKRLHLTSFTFNCRTKKTHSCSAAIPVQAQPNLELFP